MRPTCTIRLEARVAHVLTVGADGPAIRYVLHRLELMPSRICNVEAEISDSPAVRLIRNFNVVGRDSQSFVIRFERDMTQPVRARDRAQYIAER